MTKTPLTLISSQGGCAAKIGPNELRTILNGLEFPDDISRSVINNREDAGCLPIYNTGIKIIQSIDVITPVSDDPWNLGAISAAHALSDLYAKGAKPLSGLVFLGIPLFQVSPKDATKILQGAIDKLAEAGAFMLGGHTISTKELQVGLSVTGTTTDSIITNTGCKDGDVLILTKPIGSGVILTALKLFNSGAPINGFNLEIVERCEQIMLHLNSEASRAIKEVGVHACTDVTGFGFIGHLMEMLNGNDISAVINFESIPYIQGVHELAKQNISSTGGEKNSAFWWDDCQYEIEIDYSQKMILFDPQTSGGLLISVSPDRANLLVEKLVSAGVKTARIVGKIIPKKDVSIIILP